MSPQGKSFCYVKTAGLTHLIFKKEWNEKYFFLDKLFLQEVPH